MLTVTYHTYKEDGRHIIKESHWYMMAAKHAETLAPQTDEGITECRWVPLQDVPALQANAYDSIKDVLEEGMKKLA